MGLNARQNSNLACRSCGRSSAFVSCCSRMSTQRAGLAEHASQLQPYHPLSLAVLRNLAEREGYDDLLALVEGRPRRDRDGWYRCTVGELDD